jgi:hypothetical protein
LVPFRVFHGQENNDRRNFRPKVARAIWFLFVPKKNAFRSKKKHFLRQKKAGTDGQFPHELGFFFPVRNEKNRQQI